ncbi:MAG: small multi-drug export protein [Clostridiales bacterium]|jgi:uncharacterized membrane protein|nr:small multi-drug export protein [Clostridiales bacterium]
MSEALIEFFSSHGIPAWGVIFIISMLPIAELRLGLIAASILRVPVTQAFWICLLGNVLPLPLILLFIRTVFDWLKRRGWLVGLISWLESLAMRKSDSIKRRLFVGLFFFVAIPLPGTGGWTGALIAALLGMDVKKSMAAIALGVLMAGLIMVTVAYLIPGFFGFTV